MNYYTFRASIMKVPILQKCFLQSHNQKQRFSLSQPSHQQQQMQMHYFSGCSLLVLFWVFLVCFFFRIDNFNRLISIFFLVTYFELEMIEYINYCQISFSSNKAHFLLSVCLVFDTSLGTQTRNQKKISEKVVKHDRVAWFVAPSPLSIRSLKLPHQHTLSGSFNNNC